jgi:histidinol-phosphate/aromatic aminotransferase/cobyric acid decarboxylase-like protein
VAEQIAENGKWEREAVKKNLENNTSDLDPYAANFLVVDTSSDEAMFLSTTSGRSLA